jgi:NADH:ubiquinone oxidoreductase subunit 5 (subunit L)/multisubunit Na+/H+ antiporter MnhA subunit
MTSAGFLQTCLLLGVFVPLGSFVLLVFASRRLAGWTNRLLRILGREPRPGPHQTEARGDRGHHSDDAAHAPRGPAPGEPLAGWIASAAIAFSLLMALICLLTWAGASGETRAAWTQQARDAAAVWMHAGDVPIRFGVTLDSLTIIMFLMVSLCATCIHVFSIGYMKGDPRFSRFFAFLSLFCFSMLGLVISADMLFLFVFWELVGVCSYLLIGFWFERKSASDAAIKAFVVNRVGDFGFMIGVGLCFVYLGTLSLDGASAVFEAAAHRAGWAHGAMSSAAEAVPAEQAARAAQLFAPGWLGVALATWLGIGLFCGAMGKSAQVPLQVWLPDAMEGPTPVSALIHAATMVAAGVYLVARIFTLLTPGAQLVIAIIGCLTLTLAALIAIVQVDIKRVLAYSTLSQLGYMIFGMGVGAWTGALFHLLTHAFFKALLFLGAGQVIAGCHHEQDMRRMGGLRDRMPVTFWTFVVAVLAISGAGIPWLGPGLGGYYSKDEILAVAYHRTVDWSPAAAPTRAANPPFKLVSDPPASPGAMSHDAAESHGDPARAYTGVAPLPWPLLLLPILVAYITPFYMGRCLILTFLGRPRDEHVYRHAHESPIMFRPLVVLAFMTIVSGWFLFRSYVSYAAPQAPALVPAIDGKDHALHAAHTWLPLLVGFAWIVGLAGAYRVYAGGLELAERLRQHPLIRPLHALLWNKFYFDHVYDAVIVRGTRGVLAVGSRLFDNWVVDGLVNLSAWLTERISRFSGVVLDNMGVDGLVNGLARLCWTVGGALRTLQTGVIRNYVLLAAVGVTAALISLWDAVYAAALAAIVAAFLVWPTLRRDRALAGER